MGEGCAARRERGGLLLGGRGAGEWWTARWQKAVLLGDRGGLLGGKGMYCWAGYKWAAWRERAVLLGGRKVDSLGGEAVLLGGRKVDC